MSPQKSSRTFSFASLFLESNLRQDLATLYKFCRLIDDLVDESQNKFRAENLLDLIESDLKLGVSRIADVNSFLELSAKHKIDARITSDFIAGVRSDLVFRQPATEDDLIRYCYRVAGTVGVMVSRTMQIESEIAIRYAIDLGIAMQLTNIARDVVEDFLSHRVYLPRNWISADDIEEAILRDDQALARVRIAQQKILSLAEVYYRSSDNGICYLPARAKLGILTASRCYEQIGAVILSRSAKYLAVRACTTGLMKCAAVVSSAKFLLLPARDQIGFHNSRLHSSLLDLPGFESNMR